MIALILTIPIIIGIAFALILWFDGPSVELYYGLDTDADGIRDNEGDQP